MEGQYRNPPTGREAVRHYPQQRIQHGQLVVHRDPQSLERAADRQLHLRLRQVPARQVEPDAHPVLERMARFDRLRLQEARDQPGVRLVGVFLEHGREFFLAQPGEQP